MPTDDPHAIAPKTSLARRRPVLRALVALVITTLAMLFLAWILPGFHLNTPQAAVVAAILWSLLNALVWPLLIRFALPFTVLTLGIGVFVLNGVFIGLISVIYPDVQVDDLWTAILVALGITLINTVATSFLAIDDDEFWYRNVAARQARRVAGVEPTDVPGLFFLEIDGLAHAVVQRAIRDGNMPTVSAWLREGTHHLIRWETDWSSQTGACQAGLLHGSNDDMPAFRWWEKDRQQAVVTNKARDAKLIEERHSNGRGLLYADGASRANILSGDAPHSLLTMSTAMERRRGRLGQDYFGYFSNPYSVLRTLLTAIGDIAVERRYAMQQRRRDVVPRIHRSHTYALMRAWATCVQLDLQVASVVSDIYAGRPVAYTTFLAYDEVAHHSGVERPDALAVLRKVDQAIARIVAAAADAPRPYRFVVLADHGQSQGQTFLQRYDESLEQLVSRLCHPDSQLVATDAADTGGDILGVQIAAGARSDSSTQRALARTAKATLGDDNIDVEDENGDEKKAPPELVVMASGCLGLVTFPRIEGRATLAQLEDQYPELLPALIEHPGIGFVLVRTADGGSVVLGPRGTRRVDTGVVTGEDPLEPFGPNAARHVARTDAFQHCADLMINSTYWAETDEVAAFEELVGSHGGMGGEQCFPFAVVPVDFKMPEEPVVGSVTLHHHMRGWLADLGQDAYRDDA